MISLSEWRAQGRSFSFNGLPIRYWRAGEGEPLLLIHGFPTSSWDWHRIWPQLTEHYQVIACDMLGFGESAKPRRFAYSLLSQADLLQALLGHLNIQTSVHLLAHDYGDSVAQELLARHQEGRFAVASCVFLNGGLFPETHQPIFLQKLLLSPLGPWLGRLFNQRKLKHSLAKILGPDTQLSDRAVAEHWQLIVHNQGPKVLHRLIGYMPERVTNRARWVGAMQQTQVPMRVIDGALDPISGAHMVARYRELIANPDTVLLERIGHYPQLEAPLEVWEHYHAFRQRLC